MGRLTSANSETKTLGRLQALGRCNDAPRVSRPFVAPKKNGIRDPNQDIVTRGSSVKRASFCAAFLLICGKHLVVSSAALVPSERS